MTSVRASLDMVPVPIVLWRRWARVGVRQDSEMRTWRLWDFGAMRKLPEKSKAAVAKVSPASNAGYDPSPLSTDNYTRRTNPRFT